RAKSSWKMRRHEEADRGSNTAQIRASGFARRSPASVSATAVGWCAKSSYTVTPSTTPTISRRRLIPARSEERRVGKDGTTRSTRDWSSDVCSSELPRKIVLENAAARRGGSRFEHGPDPRVRIRQAQPGERLGDGGRMVCKVVVHRDAVHHADDFEATFDTRKIGRASSREGRNNEIHS